MEMLRMRRSLLEILGSCTPMSGKGARRDGTWISYSCPIHFYWVLVDFDLTEMSFESPFVSSVAESISE